MKIGKIKLNHHSVPLIIPEMGINHGGKIDVAIQIAKSAKRAGAKIIKNQTHIAEDEYSVEAKKIIPDNANTNIVNIIKNSKNKSRTRLSLNTDICKPDQSEYPIRPLCMGRKMQILKEILNEDAKMRENFNILKSINTREARIIKRNFIHILNNMTSWRKSVQYTTEALEALLNEVDDLNTSRPLNARNDIFENLSNITELPTI